VAVEMRSPLSTLSPPSFISFDAPSPSSSPSAAAPSPLCQPWIPSGLWPPNSRGRWSCGVRRSGGFLSSHRARALRRPTLVEVRQMQHWGSSDPRPTGC
jgi:hypothetical protein